MDCPACQLPNPDEARFCTGCGARLGEDCANCGAALPPAAKFCPECGASASAKPAVAKPEAGRRAERRPLTVLVSDLVDSTRLSSELDLEDWRELVRVYQQVCVEAIERLEGHVAQYLGDGVLAYFGYPRAHEDAAERAIRAGLQIARAFAQPEPGSELEGVAPLEVRVGIHTGPVVVGEMGSGTHRETLAVGETANIATRLEGIAAPNSVVISGDTLRLVGGIFVTEDLGSPPLKGVTRSVTAHRAVRGGGVRGRLPLAAAAGAARFVGRDLEMGLLRDRWERVLEGEGQSVLVSGAAGIGKSRLILALREGLGARSHLWLECSASGYRKETAFHPFVELLERGLAFAAQDEPVERLRRLDLALARMGIEREETLLAELLDLPTDAAGGAETLGPEERRARTIEALTSWALALAEDQPVLLLVEDLQWADPSTLDLLERLIDQIPTGRVLMLMTARSEFEVPWARPKNWSFVALDRLRRRQAREIVESLQTKVSLDPPAVDQIIDRADGIPLYLEELVHAAVESIDQAIQIPATLQDSLMARLDRLGSAKEVAQLASVVGREFSYPLLAGAAELDGPVLDEQLGRLVASDLVLQRGTPPESSYVFRHALICEAAYGSLLRARRRVLHARVAETLEQLSPERAKSEPEILARHYEEANNAARAIPYYVLAGERATARSAAKEAAAALRRGLDLLINLPAGRARDHAELELLLALGPTLNASLGAGDAETGRVYTRARELCEEGAPALLHVLAGLFTHHLNQADLQGAFEVAEEQLALAEKSDDPAAQTRAHWSLGQALCVRGEPAAAVAELERAVQLFDPARDRSLSHDRADPGVAMRSWRAWALWLAGRPDTALASADEAVEIARAGGHPYSLAYGLGFGAVLTFMMRDRARAAERAREASALSREGGFPLYQAVGDLVRIWAEAVDLSEDRESQALVEAFRGGIGSMSGMSSLFGRPMAAAGLAEILRQSAQPGEALAVVEETLEFTGRSGVAFWNADLMRLQAELLMDLAEGNDAAREPAEKLLANALELAREQGARSLELRVATQLALQWLERGEGGRTRDALVPLLEDFDEGFETQDLRAAAAAVEASTA